MTDIVKLITETLSNNEPVLGKPEMKALAIATVTQNFAVAARRNRPVYASNVVKDISQFNNSSSGIDVGSLLMLAAMQDKQEKPQEPTADENLTAVLDTLSQRLDAIEGHITSNG